jgi:phospholipid/cholesterol/gamma-HCH transport system substrate-binding protein
MPSPARIRWAIVRSIAVAATSLFILGTLVYLLGGDTFFQKKATIYLYIPDATGLDKGSPVRVNGIGVGKVDLVQLSGSSQAARIVRVSMTIRLDNLAVIPTDSTAQLSTDTLIGDKFIDIDKGTDRATLQPNGEIKYKEQLDVLKSLDLEQFEKQMRALDDVIAEIEQGRTRVGQFILQDTFYQSLIAKVNRLDSSFRRAAATTGQVGREVYTTTFYRRIEQPIQQFDLALARLQSGQGPAGKLLQSDEQYQSLRASVNSLFRTIADLRASEIAVTETNYSNADNQVISLIRAVDAFNAGPTFGVPVFYENLTGAARELRESVHSFREDPRKYLRLKAF